MTVTCKTPDCPFQGEPMSLGDLVIDLPVHCGGCGAELAQPETTKGDTP